MRLERKLRKSGTTSIGATSIVGFFLCTSVALANPISVQGRLHNAAGVSVDGTYQLSIAFYDSETAKEPTLAQPLDDVTVDGGVFSLELQFPAELLKSADQAWIGVTVSGEDELPRRPIRSVPFAMWASNLACSGCVSKDELDFAIYTQAEMDAMTADFVTANEVAEQISVGGYAPLASLAEVATSGNFADLKTIPKGLLDGDNDLLGTLKCQEGQVAQWTNGLWQCATPASATIIKSLDQPFLDLVNQFIANMPGLGSGGFAVPSGLERTLFGEAVDALAAGDLTLSQTLAGLVDYELVLAQDIRVLRPLAGADKGRGLFALASTFKRDLVLSAPHPKFDSSSGIRAAEAFLDVKAKAFAVAGTHRCANAAFSGCDGTTSVCGSSQPYRESDQAHTEKGFFQEFHQRLSPGRTTLQFHGFKSNSGDPEFTFSDGTTANSTEPLHLGNLLAIDLEQRVEAAGSAKKGNSCNRVGDINKLCGSTNTQGRFLNGVAVEEVCASFAPNSNQSFIHMELSYDLRHFGGTLEPQLIFDAIKAVVPAQ